MSGSEWNKYLNGGTSQFNFSYKSNTPVAPIPASSIPAPVSAPIPSPIPVPNPNIINKKNNNTKINIVKTNNVKTNNVKTNNKNKTLSGGKRKSRRRITKRK